jgi:hypothetical protein
MVIRPASPRPEVLLLIRAPPLTINRPASMVMLPSALSVAVLLVICPRPRTVRVSALTTVSPARPPTNPLTAMLGVPMSPPSMVTVGAERKRRPGSPAAKLTIPLGEPCVF